MSPRYDVESKYMHIPAAKRTFTIVSMIAYLIGVKKDAFENGRLNLDVYERFDEQVPARRIRALCRIRNTLMWYYEDIERAFKYDMKNLDTLPHFFSAEDLQFLHDNGVSLVKTNARPIAYFGIINQFILSYLHECSELFPLWIEWPFIRDLFVMGDAAKEAVIRETIWAFRANYQFFPYQCYVNWRFDEDYGNILFFDAKFVTLLYEMNGMVFNDYHMVIDAGYGTQNFFHKFIMENEKVVFIVDCENSDPYRLCSTFRNISAYHDDFASHISKIILYDDVNAPATWGVFNKYVKGIDIERRVVQRLQGGKSLVDSNMIMGATEEFYTNGVRAFVVVSSDSDFYALTTSLTASKFLIMLEHGKQSRRLIDALESSGIPYCFIDNFSQGDVNDMKTDALISQTKTYVQDRVQLNVASMMVEICKKARVELSKSEEKAFLEKYVKRLRLSVDDNGDVSIVIPEY